MEEKFIIGIIVRNHFGVLTRVTSLFSRRGYNIDSLVVGVTDDTEYSRMTIVVCGDEYIKDQIVKQLEKLHDVMNVAIIPMDQAVVREHMLVKLEVVSDNNAEITAFLEQFGAKMIDFGASFITAEVTGDADSNDKFVQDAKKFGIMEICRAGAQALNRGTTLL